MLQQQLRLMQMFINYKMIHQTTSYVLISSAVQPIENTAHNSVVRNRISLLLVLRTEIDQSLLRYLNTVRIA